MSSLHAPFYVGSAAPSDAPAASRGSATAENFKVVTYNVGAKTDMMFSSAQRKQDFRDKTDRDMLLFYQDAVAYARHGVDDRESVLAFAWPGHLSVPSSCAGLIPKVHVRCLCVVLYQETHVVLLQEVSASLADHLRSKKPSTWKMFGSGETTCGVWIFFDREELDAVVPPQRTRLFPGDDNQHGSWREFTEAGH